jgi:lipopolysaccharide export system permease protein
MKKIDSYILKKFLGTFLFCLVLMTVIVIVVDASEKTDEFTKAKLPLWRIITEYYFGFIPHIDSMLFPLFVFISVIFFTAKMAERSEVIAILSSGVSFRRFLLPYWMGSIFLGLILWIGYQNLLPKANEIWGTFLTKYVDIDYGATESKAFPQNYYFRVDSDTYAGIHSYDTTSKLGSFFFIQQFKDNKLTYNLRADNIIWDTASRKWKLNNVVTHSFAGDQEHINRNASLLMSYDFKPSDLRRDDYLKDRLSTTELNKLISKQHLQGLETVSELEVERYSRDAIPVSVVILTLIGAILSSRKVRGGSGLHLAAGVVLSVVYILFSRFSLVFATKGNLSPVLAAWIPNIVFAGLTYYLYRRISR